MNKDTSNKSPDQCPRPARIIGSDLPVSVPETSPGLTSRPARVSGIDPGRSVIMLIHSVIKEGNKVG